MIDRVLLKTLLLLSLPTFGTHRLVPSVRMLSLLSATTTEVNSSTHAVTLHISLLLPAPAHAPDGLISISCGASDLKDHVA